METSKFDNIQEFPIEFLVQISEILNDDNKFNELQGMLDKASVFIENTMYKKQLTINSRAELIELRDRIKKLLIPA
jgi:hypothetical protein